MVMKCFHFETEATVPEVVGLATATFVFLRTVAKFGTLAMNWFLSKVGGCAPEANTWQVKIAGLVLALLVLFCAGATNFTLSKFVVSTSEGLSREGNTDTAILFG